MMQKTQLKVAPEQFVGGVSPACSNVQRLRHLQQYASRRCAAAQIQQAEGAPKANESKTPAQVTTKGTAQKSRRTAHARPKHSPHATNTLHPHSLPLQRKRRGRERHTRSPSGSRFWKLTSLSLETFRFFDSFIRA